jgi:Ser/Thr protein kinase RdoA (MazF antagonist)
MVHGDFYRRNILCRDGRIVGLIDWDEARHDRLVAELAWSVWEFAKSDDGTTLLPDRARAFLNDYRNAGGPIAPSGALLPLIRAHLRYEVDRAEHARNAGEYMDPDYQAAEITAFHTLAEFTQLSG